MMMASIMRMSAALTVSAVSLFAQADALLETWARDLVDHEHMRAGAREDLVDVWLGHVESNPGHVLVEPTLRMIEQLGAMRDPAAVGARLRTLDGRALRPVARHVHERLVAKDRVRRDPVETLGDDLYPSVLSIYAVAGPLPPTSDPLALEQYDLRLDDPGFDIPMFALEGTTTWTSLRRLPLRGALDLTDRFDPERGFALVAARFVVSEGGPGWIEIDSGDAALRPVGPSVAFCVNGGQQKLIDRWRERTGPAHREPVVLKSGHNVVVMKVAIGQSPSLAVRVMAPDGSPYPGLSQNYDLRHGDLSEVVDAAPPTGDFPDALAELEALGAARSADVTAVLGIMHFLDGARLAGLAHMRAAYEQSERPGHAALLASFTNDCQELPASWRRSEARSLAESVAEAYPNHLPAGLFLADVMVSEDREAEAIGLLQRLTSANPTQVRSLMQLQQVYGSLGMQAESEAAVGMAWERAPEHPTVMRRRAELLSRAGLGSESLRLIEQAARREGVTAGRLVGLSRQWGQRGHTRRAVDLLVESLHRGGNRSQELALARLMHRTGEDAAGAKMLSALARRYPRWLDPRWEQALIAYRDGDVEAERERLEDVLRVEPAHLPARRRLAVLTGEDAVEALFERFEVDGEALLAEYSGGLDQDASVVRVLDHQIVYVETDGTLEVQTHEIVQPRDLNGCDAEGTVRLRGEVLDIATVKGDGTRYEPVRVSGEYVMPLLEPGDFIETIERDRRAAARDGLVRLGRWYFASSEQPFWLSRYVVSVPKDLDIAVEFGHFDGTYEVIDEGDRVVHVMERRRSERILPEPGMPPRDWFAPWVEIGERAESDRAVLDALREPLLPLARVSPQVRDVVDEVRAAVGDAGQAALARALYDRAVASIDSVDGRLSSSATQALLSRSGNPSVILAAFLAAAGIDYEFVWSRGIVPEGDPEPDPTFLAPNWIGRRLYVVVRPSDGPEAWCDPTQRTMPYGVILRDAPGALAFGTDATGMSSVPDAPLTDRPGYSVQLTVQVESDGAAAVSGVGTMTGNLGYPFKEQARNIPTAAHRIVIAQVAAAVVPGVDVESFDVSGLDDVSAHLPLRVEVRGRVPRFLDDDGAGFTCALPMPPLNLSASFGGEGERRLPLLLSTDRADHISVRLEVPAGLQLQAAPDATRVEFPRGWYELSVSSATRADGTVIWTFERQLALGAFSVGPEGYADFAATCARIDELERTRLRFTR